MAKVLLVGLGGALGAVSRYLVQGYVHRFIDPSWFPVGTAAVNLTGCVLIGVASGLVEYRDMFSPETRVLIIVGVLGGFTTFSTFGAETYDLLRAGQPGLATTNVMLQVFLGVAGVWLGHSVIRFF